MASAADNLPPGLQGLSSAEAERRRAAGQGNDVEVSGRPHLRSHRPRQRLQLHQQPLLLPRHPASGPGQAARRVRRGVRDRRQHRHQPVPGDPRQARDGQDGDPPAAQGGRAARRGGPGDRPVAGGARRRAAARARRPGGRGRADGRRGPHGGGRVAAHRRVGPRHQAPRRRAHVRQLLHDRRRLLRGGPGRPGQLRQQAHRQGDSLQARAHAAAAPGGADRARPAHRRHRVRDPGVGAQRRRRRAVRGERAHVDRDPGADPQRARPEHRARVTRSGRYACWARTCSSSSSTRWRA